jgi:hypothetical protein
MQTIRQQQALRGICQHKPQPVSDGVTLLIAIALAMFGLGMCYLLVVVIFGMGAQ